MSKADQGGAGDSERAVHGRAALVVRYSRADSIIASVDNHVPKRPFDVIRINDRTLSLRGKYGNTHDSTLAEMTASDPDIPKGVEGAKWYEVPGIWWGVVERLSWTMLGKPASVGCQFREVVY